MATTKEDGVVMRPRAVFLALSATIALGVCEIGCNPQSSKPQPRLTLFIGIDTSGSFRASGFYDDALSFLAHYIYGHVNQLGGLAQPREMFVAAIGGNDPDEPKAFHPIHDFAHKDVGQIEEALRDWYGPGDSLTDFNAFFTQVERIVKERNLVLAPVSVMVVTDGIPDLSVRGGEAGSQASYEEIDVGGLEYLSRRLTLRLAYTSPTAGEHWRRYVPRRRVRLWTVEAMVMEGWREQVEPNLAPAAQERLWKWIQDNVDYRVRS